MQLSFRHLQKKSWHLIPLKLTKWRKVESFCNNQLPNMLAEAILGVIYAVNTLIATSCTYIIVSYLKQKPMGMQTLLDKFAAQALVIKLGHETVRGAIVLFFMFCGRTEETIAVAVSLMLFMWNNLKQMYLLGYIIIRYLSVFHAHILESIEDGKVCKYFAIGAALITFLISAIEEAFFVPLKNSFVAISLTRSCSTQIMYNEFMLHRVVGRTSIFTLTCIQVKIWYHNRIFRKRYQHPPEESESILLSKFFIRQMLIIFAIFGALYVYLYEAVQNSSPLSMMFLGFIYTSTTNSVLVSFIVIIPQLNLHAKKILHCTKQMIRNGK